MMRKWQEIINGVRAIEAGNTPSTDISDVLAAHRCTQWLKIAYPQQVDIARSLVNKVALRERFRTCEPVFGEMAHIPYAIVKGAALSRAAYGDATMRQSGDVDLLISRTHLEEVKRLLLQQGFVQGRITANGIQPFSRRELIFQSAMSHQTAPFVKETGNPLIPYINVDINLDIFWGESEQRADMDAFLAHTTETELFGATVRILEPIYDFIFLCMHHYKDMNSLYLLSDRGLRMDQLCDILYFLKANELDISALLTAARTYGVTDYLHYCVYYANRLCPHLVFERYLQALAGGTGLTAYYGLNAVERQTWDVPFEERLLDPMFPRRFFDSLSEEQKEKVRVNRLYM